MGERGEPMPKIPYTSKPTNTQKDIGKKAINMKPVVIQLEPIHLSPRAVSKRTMEPGTPVANIEFSMELKRVINERNILTTKTKKRVIDALDEIKLKNDEETRHFKKEKALKEIVDSEKKYVSQLETIIDFFISPVKEQDILPKHKFDMLFGNIRPIYNINKELLDAISNGANNVISAFSKIAPFLKMYSVYAFEYKNILKILHEAKSAYPVFAKFIEDQETRPEVQNKLSALLITPIQRVPRYKLLLSHLHQLTKPYEKDYTLLIDSLHKIQQVASHLNNILADQEKQRGMLEYQRCLTHNHPNIIAPGRYIIKEGHLTKMTTPTTPGQKMYAVLLNDIIIFNKVKKEKLVSNSLKIAFIFPLSKCKVTEIADKGCLKVESGNEELFLYHQRLSETKCWVSEINNTITNHLQDRKTLRKESSARRPVKRKDVNEYNEVGVSPGQPMKKKRGAEEAETLNINTGLKKHIMMRPPIRAALFDATFARLNHSKNNKKSKQITIKNINQDNVKASTIIVHEEEKSDVTSENFNEEQLMEYRNVSNRIENDGENIEVVRANNGNFEGNNNNEVFVFGRQQNKQQVGGIKAFLGGVNNVIKRFLGIRS